MRTSVLHEVGGYSADLPHSADFEMWMRAAAIADVGFVGGADQAYYRMHSNNMHDVTFGVLGDFDQRLASFDKVLADRSLRVSERASLSEAAHRAVAREALSYAIGATVRNPADRERMLRTHFPSFR